MNTTAWTVFAVSALLLFWAVGARRRLTGLRQEVLAGWARIAEALSPRDAVVEPLVARLRGPLVAEQGALDAFLAAAAQARQGAAAVGARPLDATLVRQWVVAEAALAATAARLTALVAQQPLLSEQPEVTTLIATWQEAGGKLAYARQRFNEAAETYNGAIALFPTSLLARLGGLVPVGKV